MKRWLPLILSLSLCGIFAVIAATLSSPKIILNTTDSLPHGFYWVEETQSIAKGELFAFRVPEAFREMVKSRGWLPADGYLLKPVIAMSGDHVCIQDGWLKVDQLRLVKIAKRDNQGRDLPQLTLCRKLDEGELFVVNDKYAQSFDSRYFGAINRSNVIGKVVPAYIF